MNLPFRLSRKQFELSFIVEMYTTAWVVDKGLYMHVYIFYMKYNIGILDVVLCLDLGSVYIPEAKLCNLIIFFYYDYFGDQSHRSSGGFTWIHGDEDARNSVIWK